MGCIPLRSPAEQALVSEKCRDWGARFSCINVTTRELTGDHDGPVNWHQFEVSTSLEFLPDAFSVLGLECVCTCLPDRIKKG